MSHHPNTNEDDPFAEFFPEVGKEPVYWIELAKLEFTENVLARMKELGLTKGQLAAKLDMKPAMVTRIVNGQNNFTLATMVRVAGALGCEYRSHLQRPGTRTGWMDFLTDEPTEEQDEEIGWEIEEYKISTTLAIAA